MDDSIKWLGRVPGGIIGGILGWIALRTFLGSLCGIIMGSVVGEYVVWTLASRYTFKKRMEYAEMEEKWRNDLLEGILILSADIIKTGGKQRQYQLQFVKEFVVMQFGKDVVPEAMSRIDVLLNQNKIDFYQALPKLRGVVANILIRYLISLAIAGGEFSKAERELIERIGIGLNLSYGEIKSIIASLCSEFYGGEKKDDYVKNGQNNEPTPTEYVILEIKTSATNDEVRSAYRRKAMQYHPDRVAASGPEAQKEAAANFRRIHDAYETIKRERGMN